MKKFVILIFSLVLLLPLSAQISLVADINVGNQFSSSSIDNFIEFNNELIFTANDGSLGKEVYKYDGTNVTLLADINTGASNSNPQSFHILNGELLFMATSTTGTGFYVYDGSTVSLDYLIPSSFSVYETAVYNNELYFRGRDFSISIGSELYKYDGTSISLVADIYTGPSSSFPDFFIVYNNELYFQAGNASAGKELFKYDGASVSLAADINTGLFSSIPGFFKVFNNKLFFAAGTGTTGVELYMYDGSSASLVSDINAGSGGSDPQELAVYGNSLYFQALNPATGRELYEYDGTAVSLVQDLNSGAASSTPRGLTVLQNVLYLVTSAGATNGFELYSYDGTTLNIVEDLNPGSGSGASVGPKPTVFQGAVYFYGSEGTMGLELYRFTPLPTEWTGANSSAWSDGGNWSKGNVPSAFEGVLIPTTPSGNATNFPIADQDIVVEKLTVEAGASLEIAPGFGLINQNGTISNNGTILLKANAANTAYYDDFTFGGSFGGNLTIEQFVSLGNSLGQRMFGSPVNNGVVQGLDQTYASASTGQIVMSNCSTAIVDIASPYNNIFEWQEDVILPNNCEYEAWFARLQSSPLENGRGYSAWMNTNSKITFTGSPNSGTITYGGSLANSNTGLSNKDGWHVLSNPYPSPVNVQGLSDEGWSSLQTYDASQAFGGTFQPVLPGQDLGIAQGFVAKIPDASGAPSSLNAFASSATGATAPGLNMGLAFDVVNAPITVDRLGAYDAGADGLAGVSTVTIYDRNSQAIVVQSTLSGSSFPLEEGFRWKDITPVVLPVGNYIVARYSDTEANEWASAGITPNTTINNLDFSSPNPKSFFASGAAYPSTNWQNSFNVAAGSFSVQVAPLIPNSATFADSMRVASGSAAFKSNTNWYNAKLDIEVSNGTSQDITYIYFNNDATQAFDNQWDCEKRDSDAGIPTLFTSTTGKQTSLNGNHISELGNYSFPMGLKPGSDNNFTFTVEGIVSFPATTLIYLEDKATGTWTNLRETNTYAFNMTTQEAEDRFEIHFTKPLTLTYEAESCEGNDGSIAIDFGNQSIAGNLQTWDFEIELASTVIASASEANLTEIQDLEPGVYEITFTNGNLQTTEAIEIEDKQQVEANFDANATTLFIGDELNLSNLSNGATSFEWEVNGEFFSTNDLNYTFSAPGTYVVSLRASNADCEAFMEQSFIVNEKTTGIAEQIELDKVNVYTQGQTIVVDLSGVQLEGQTDLAIYDMVGQLLIEKFNANSIEYIDMDNANGIYFVKIMKQGEQISRKVILK